MLAACGPSLRSTGEHASTSTGDSSTGSANIQTSSSSSATGSTAESGEASSSASASTGAPLDCANEGESCPDGCEIAKAYAGGGWECIDQSTERTVCTERGQQLAKSYASAWWKELDGQPYVLMTGHACPEQVEHEPLDWTECTGSVDEPPACRCLCHQDVCDGEVEVEMAENCNEPMVCPPASGWLKGGTQLEMLCVFEGWRDRVPGLYQVDFPGPNDSTSFRLLVAGDGSVQVSRYMLYLTVCPSPLSGLWRPARDCQLADVEFFAACAMPDTPIGDCETDPITIERWIENCADEPLVCE